MDAPAGRPVHLGDAAGLSSTRPTCSRARCARTSRSCPGRAAYLDGRGGSSMRLNFSGVGEDDDPRGHPADRQGRARAGRALRDAHGRRARAARRAEQAARAGDGPDAPASLPLRRKRRMTRRGPQGRPLARAARSRCARARGSRTRSSASATRSCAIDVGPDLVDRLRGRAPGRRVRRAARPRRRGRHGAGAARAARRSRTPARARRPASRCMDKVLAKHALRDAGHPDAGLLRVQPDRLRGARRRAGAAGDRGAPRLPDRRQAGAARARRSASSSPRTAADVPGALVAAFSYDTKVLLERHVDGRDLAVSVLDGPTARGAARRRGDPARRATSTTSRRATRSARTDFVCPADARPTAIAERAQELARRGLRAARLLRASRAST